MNSLTLLWIIFWSMFIVISAIDLFVVTHTKSAGGVKQSLCWTGLWICVALSFAIAIYFLHPGGAPVAMQYVTGYLTEYSLSVDNLFVFIMTFSLMGVHEAAQPKIIKIRIYLSIALRIAFIVFGLALVQKFEWLLYPLGGVLIWTAWKMLAADEDEQVHPEKNLLYWAASKVFPVHAEDQSKRRFFTRHDGKLCMTPLFLAFLVIGSIDLVFAMDSIPAIMGISTDPFVAITSNVFAVTGLNALFFAVRGIMGLFKFLKHGVSIILFFIGGKMVAGMIHSVDVWFRSHNFVSLLVIVLVLGVSIVLSVWHDRSMEPKTDGEPSI
ncbi:MAG: TerC/Alx family metal homeostasis membrane protein [Nibricoccus sp.]